MALYLKLLSQILSTPITFYIGETNEKNNLLLRYL